MILRVGRGGVTVGAPVDLTGLKVVSDGSAEAAGRLTDLADETDEDHVWIAPDRLADLVPDDVATASWRADFDAMVATAARYGWVDEHGRVRLHVETEAPGADDGPTAG